MIVILSLKLIQKVLNLNDGKIQSHNILIKAN